MAKYLQTLLALGIVAKRVPVGENPATSRKGAYELAEACYAYWHRFVSAYATEVEGGLGSVVARRTAFGKKLDTYVGQRFEVVCRDWLSRQAREGLLPVEATVVGSWWGNDPVVHEQTDIDAIALDSLTGDAVFCECTWRNSFDETEAIEGLQGKRNLVRGCKATHFCLFGKRPASVQTQRKYSSDKTVRLLCVDDLAVF